jgi:multimeric flavodoxin WrbA
MLARAAGALDVQRWRNPGRKERECREPRRPGVDGSPAEGTIRRAAALEGAAKAGAHVELVQMADHVVEACKDCLPSECKDTLKCAYPDTAFEHLSQKLLRCGALILGAPIYWWDTTGMVGT